MHERDDSETTMESLVRRACGGDREAYDALFAREAERALLFVRLRMGPGLRDRMESIDVLQEVYLQALKDLESFEPRGAGSFGRWMCRLIENRIRGLVDAARAAKRRAPGEQVAVTRFLEECSVQGSGPATRAQGAERRERLLEALLELEKEPREVLVLRYFHGCTQEEIGARLGRSDRAVRRMLAQATMRLGRLLRELDG